MRSILRLVALFSLTLSVLLGSVGVALSKQLCRMADMEEMKASEGCCKKASASPEEDDCCTAKVSYEKLEPVSSLKAFTLEIPVFFPVPFKHFLPQQYLHIAKSKRILTHSDSSPPLYGRRLLHQLQVLVV